MLKKINNVLPFLSVVVAVISLFVSYGTSNKYNQLVEKQMGPYFKVFYDESDDVTSGCEYLYEKGNVKGVKYYESNSRRISIPYKNILDSYVIYYDGEYITNIEATPVIGFNIVYEVIQPESFSVEKISDKKIVQKREWFLYDKVPNVHHDIVKNEFYVKYDYSSYKTDLDMLCQVLRNNKLRGSCEIIIENYIKISYNDFNGKHKENYYEISDRKLNKIEIDLNVLKGTTKDISWIKEYGSMDRCMTEMVDLFSEIN